MLDKLPLIKDFFAFLAKNERALYLTIITVLVTAIVYQYKDNRKLYSRIEVLQNTTIEYERKKGAIFEEIVNQQIRQQMLREQMLKEKTEQK